MDERLWDTSHHHHHHHHHQQQQQQQASTVFLLTRKHTKTSCRITTSYTTNSKSRQVQRLDIHRILVTLNKPRSNRELQCIFLFLQVCYSSPQKSWLRPWGQRKWTVSLSTCTQLVSGKICSTVHGSLSTGSSSTASLVEWSLARTPPGCGACFSTM